MTSATRPARARLAAFAVVWRCSSALFEVALRTWGSSEAAPAFQGLFIPDPASATGCKPGARVRFTTAEFDTEIAINGAGVRDDEEIGPKAAERAAHRRPRRLAGARRCRCRSAQTFGELLEAAAERAASPFATA